MEMKKIIVLMVTLTALLLQACGSSSASAVNEVTTDYTPIIGYDFKSTTETSVEVTSQQSGTVIKFTTDGTIPTFTTTTATSSFTVTSETTVKAIAYDNSGNALSDVVTVKVPVGKMPVTIMYYGDADNNLEKYLLQDVAEMKLGYSKAGYNLITLFDRISANELSDKEKYKDSTDSSVFGENFTGTRLYKIGDDTPTRLSDNLYLGLNSSGDSDELNMGDAATLQKFIQYCKVNYPADKYVLIMSNHGGGTRSVKSTSSSTGDVKAICWDDTDGDDALYTGEISNTLTSDESVDVMVLDACLMGSVEFAYQFRNDSSNTGFKSNYMVASPALVWGYGLPYTKILQRIRGISGNNGTANTLGGGTEAYIVPSSTMNMAEFSKMIVEEQYDDTTSQTSETFSAYDLSKVTALKTAIDNFAKSMISDDTYGTHKASFESIRGTSSSNTAMNYFDSSSSGEWAYYPFFDVYDLVRVVSSSTAFTSTTRTKASAVRLALANVVLSSFGGTDFYNANNAAKVYFQNNLNGMHIVFPKYSVSDLSTPETDWIYWYTPANLKTLTSGTKLYGNLSFCSGGTEGNTTVESWFEMIDKWYDNTVANSGKGYNYYKY